MNNNKIKAKAIIFDLWGTVALGEEATHLFERIQQRLGLNELTVQEFTDGLEKSIMTQKFETEKEMMKAVCDYFSIIPADITVNDLILLIRRNDNLSKPYDDAAKIIQELDFKSKIGLISNTTCFGPKKLLQKFSLDKYFKGKVFSFEVGLLKPNPKIFKLALNRLDSSPKETVMIGDSLKKDIIPAKNLGMKTILVDRNKKYTQTKEADAIINSLNELNSVLEKEK